MSPMDRANIDYLDNIKNCDSYVDVYLDIVCLNCVGFGQCSYFGVKF
jgi:hypothetical protein